MEGTGPRPLERIELGSSCCGATVYDPGGTGEGLCTDCKEHCSEAYIQPVSLMVLTTDGRAHHHLLNYSSEEDKENEGVDSFVMDFVSEHYGVDDCRYVYDENKYLEFLDHDKING